MCYHKTNHLNIILLKILSDNYLYAYASSRLYCYKYLNYLHCKRYELFLTQKISVYASNCFENGNGTSIKCQGELIKNALILNALR